MSRPEDVETANLQHCDVGRDLPWIGHLCLHAIGNKDSRWRLIAARKSQGGADSEAQRFPHQPRQVVAHPPLR
jgi:hypothetical protein